MSTSCPGGTCLYIADTGDNAEERAQIVLYRVPEPVPEVPSASAEAFQMVFPDEPQDVEAMFVLPGEQVYFVTKGAERPIALYRYPGPLRTDQTVELELVRDVDKLAEARLFGLLTQGGNLPLVVLDEPRIGGQRMREIICRLVAPRQSVLERLFGLGLVPGLFQHIEKMPGDDQAIAA